MSAAVCARPKHALGPVGTETSFFGFASGSRLRSSSLLEFHRIRPYPFALVGNSVAVASNGRRVELCGRSQSTRRWDAGTTETAGASDPPKHAPTRFRSLPVSYARLPSACLPVPAPTPICNVFPEETGLGDSRHFARFIGEDRLISAFSRPPNLFSSRVHPDVFSHLCISRRLWAVVFPAF